MVTYRETANEIITELAKLGVESNISGLRKDRHTIYLKIFGESGENDFLSITIRQNQTATVSLPNLKKEEVLKALSAFFDKEPVCTSMDVGEEEVFHWNLGEISDEEFVNILKDTPIKRIVTML